MTNIFFGNLSFQTTQDELLAAFSQFGNVERVNIVTDRETGQVRGFAFVEMTERGEAENAISRPSGDQRGDQSPSEAGMVEIRRVRRSKTRTEVEAGAKPAIHGAPANASRFPSGDHVGFA